MKVLTVLILIVLLGCTSAFTGLHKGMYHQKFHQVYADKLDGWMERPFSSQLIIGDYHWKNGPRVVVLWRKRGGYLAVDDYRVYYNDFDNYDWLDKYINMPNM